MNPLLRALAEFLLTVAKGDSQHTHKTHTYTHSVKQQEVAKISKPKADKDMGQSSFSHPTEDLHRDGQDL